MPDEMEQIEARLAAYIDGTLPATQRVEIEAYLKANPAHAKLISELVSLKNAVSSLPREKAPAEVLDTLQAQIERHALLDEDEDDTSPMRITRWPAFGSAAAVLLLAAGLGLLVYQVLPKPKSVSDLALLSTTRAGEVVLSDAESPPAAKPSTTPPREGIARAVAVPPLEATTSPTLNGFGGGGGGGFAQDAVAAAPAAPGQAVPQLNQRMAVGGNQLEFGMAQLNNVGSNTLSDNVAAGGATNGPQQANFGSIAAAVTVSDPVRVVIVRSDDPALTQNLLVGSLVADKTPFEFADWPTVAPTTQAATTRPTVDELMTRLYATGDLAARDASATGIRPVVLRGVTGDRALGVLNALDEQRPGRQKAAWAGETALKDTRADAGRSQDAEKLTSATKPATAKGESNALLPTTVPDDAVATTSKLSFTMVSDSLLAVRRPATLPAALPATLPATQPMPSSDLVVLVLARPTPATVPASQATTTPQLP